MTMACLASASSTSAEPLACASEVVQVPTPVAPEPPARRNLTEAFEELYLERTAQDDNDPSPAAGSSAVTSATATVPSMLSPTVVDTHIDVKDPTADPDTVSPTGVADPVPAPSSPSVETTTVSPSFPEFGLHASLQRDLSQALVDRVSFYAIIHDINKEAVTMASHDPLANQALALEEEEFSPLVQAATGRVQERTGETVKNACIDEEVWLLSTIARRSTESVVRRSCPDTFLQAMGEKEYENPVQSLAGASRTQLWKPSRSWWEAKSGKNPWIEPSSHNKRWRYLWPLIHYHKFLAKCIKKLKRNGVDVKNSVSPVAVFLREEVCSVSDHLAAVSLFGSEEWMNCLQHFEGWTDTSLEAEERLRKLVASLQLRPLQEQGDVDSPLLRSQIDEHFLRTMAAARMELRDKSVELSGKKGKRPSTSSSGQPPMYPRPPSGSSPHQQPVPKQIPAGVRRPRWGYPPPHGAWYPYDPHQHPHQQPYPGDTSSVHSALSLDSYPQPQQPYPDYGMYPMPPPPYPHYPYYGPPPPPASASDNSQSTGGFEQSSDPSMGYPDPRMHGGWMDPAMMYAMQQQHAASGYGPPPSTPTSPDESMATAEYPNPDYQSSPYGKYEHMPASPFWSHLDRATLAMGLATPAKASPETPRRTDDRDDHDRSDSTDEEKDNGFAANAQPLLLLPNQYYGYGPGYGEQGYGPPSPATQFMMSPQASFAYNYGYGFSPHRPPRSTRRPDSLSETPKERESPATVETTAETESFAA